MESKIGMVKHTELSKVLPNVYWIKYLYLLSWYNDLFGRYINMNWPIVIGGPINFFCFLVYYSLNQLKVLSA